MRKNVNKSMRGDKMTVNPGISKRRFLTSKSDIAKIPVFTPVDDEEYFFEVEDF